MIIEFKAKTNKDYCMVNTAIFHLKDGGNITIDRKETYFSVKNGILSMDWEGCYLWEVNGEAIFDGHYYPFIADAFSITNLLKGSWVELCLEDDAEEDYIVTDVTWTVTACNDEDYNGKVYTVSGNDNPPIDSLKLLEKIMRNNLYNSDNLITELNSTGLGVYDTIDEYLMENFGTTQEEIESLGIKLVA